MKIRSIHLKNFKRFRDYRIDFTNPDTGLTLDRIVLVGPNGAGKSSILQAIALTLGLATRRIQSASKLSWPGFEFELIDSNWPTPSEIAIEVEFDIDEIAAITECYERLPKEGNRSTLKAPGKHTSVTVHYSRGAIRATGGPGARFQFYGREYVRQLMKYEKTAFHFFAKVGSIFWWDESRNITSLLPDDGNGKSVKFSDSVLRRRLIDWLEYHRYLKGNRGHSQMETRDFYAELAPAFEIVFPQRSFEGPRPKTSPSDILEEPYFMLSHNGRFYDIAEMSGGERATFPILFDFIRLSMSYSVVLIDELELHLHPPMQQSLIGSLSKIGCANQIIFTSHSDWVLDALPKSNVRKVVEE